jgi:hypothetical protein
MGEVLGPKVVEERTLQEVVERASRVSTARTSGKFVKKPSVVSGELTVPGNELGEKVIRPVTGRRDLWDEGISNIEGVKVLPTNLPSGEHTPPKLTFAKEVREAYSKRNNLESRALFGQGIGHLIAKSTNVGARPIK